MLEPSGLCASRSSPKHLPVVPMGSVLDFVLILYLIEAGALHLLNPIYS